MLMGEHISLHLGDETAIRKVPFTIIGVLERNGQGMTGQDDVIKLSLSTVPIRLFGNTQGRLRRMSTIQVKVCEGVSMKDVEERIRELLRQRTQ